MKVIAETCRVN